MATRSLANFARVFRDQGARTPYWLRVVALIAFFSIVPFGFNAYVLAVAVSIITYAFLALGLNVVLGYAGLLDLGYAAFFAIGAYSTAILTTHFGWNFFATIPVAVLLTGLAGGLLGYPTLRLQSDYLAIVTLGFGEMVQLAFNNWNYVGGPNGIFPVPPPVIFGRILESQEDFYFIGLLLLLIALFFSHNLARSWIGRAWNGMRDDEVAAEATGIPALRLKLTAYVMGGMWAGLAGAFFAVRVGIVDPTSFTFVLSGMLVILVVLGGSGSIPGMILGAAVIVGLPEVLRSAANYRLLIFAIGLLAVMFFRPQGLWPRKLATSRGRKHELAVAIGESGEAAVARAPALRASEVPVGAPILRVSHVSCRFGGVRAVQDVSLEIRRGEIFSIIGPNGAGKTTLFNCVTGIVKASDGSIVFEATELVGKAPHAVSDLGLARTFQGIKLFNSMTVYENVLTSMYSRFNSTVVGALGRSRRVARQEKECIAEAEHWLRFVGLDAKAFSIPSELPYADQRRLEIARALATRPALLLLDEPAAGMNTTEKMEFVAVIRSLRDLGITIVVIDHDMPLVMAVSNRIAVLDRGRLIALDEPAAIQADPVVIAAYLGTDPGSEDISPGPPSQSEPAGGQAPLTPGSWEQAIDHT